MGRCVRYTGVFLHQRTHLRTHSLQVVHICVYVYMCMHMHMDAYVRLWYCLTRWGVVAKKFLSVHTCAYAYVCICVCMYACIGACVYVCICIYVCLCICMHIHLYTRAWVCTYALVWAHFVYLYCPISLIHARVSQVFLNHLVHG